MSVIFLLMILIYTVIFIKKKPKFGEYYSFFNSERGIIYILMLIERAVLGVLIPLSAHFQISYAQVIFICIFAFLLVIILVKKPYLQDKQSYRQVANYTIAILIQGIYLLPTFVDDSSVILAYAPLVIIFLLLVCFTYNMVLLIKQICRERDDNSEVES